MSDNAKATVKSLLKSAGITINGNKSYDIKVYNEDFYKRVLSKRELGMGESYMDGWWDCPRLDQMLTRILSTDIRSQIKITPLMVINYLTATVINKQGKVRAKRNASFHYNIGNDLYSRMLGKRMVYSCGYWKTAKNLDQAQTDKLDLICRKLQLKKGMTLLDIGCGWGGLAEYAATKYGAIVTGISPALEQVKLARARTKGLKVKIFQKDYRDIKGTYDRIVSVGMLEHVGPKNYKDFFNICKEHLADNGLMLHHTIGSNNSTNSINTWTDKYIFPGGVLPSIAQIAKAVEKRLIIEDIQNFGPYYDKTLMAWHDNFTKSYKEIKDNYDQRFYRMWNFYLLSSAAAFRARHIQLFQIVFRKITTSDAYIAPR